MQIDSLICVLGWEERFPLGMEIILKKHEIKTLVLISFIDYKLMNGSANNETTVKKLAYTYDITIIPVDLDYSNSVENWKILDSFFENNELGTEIMLNTTTFPRETIWTFLFFLKKKIPYIHYVYFRPVGYDKVWLTKNHKNPRLLFKHSGVFDLNKELALFIVTGFDLSRLDTIIEFYEPDKIVLLCQNGEQYNNLKRNIGLRANRSIKFEKFFFNSYDVVDATEQLNQLIEQYSEYNIIVSSQGPKTSALSTYKCYLKSGNRIALSYVPAKDFNPMYSIGIDPNYIEGKLEFND